MTTPQKPISEEKQVAVVLYYLPDKGNMWKVANAFGIGKTTVSKAVRRENTHGSKFYEQHRFLQCFEPI